MRIGRDLNRRIRRGMQDLVAGTRMSIIRSSGVPSRNPLRNQDGGQRHHDANHAHRPEPVTCEDDPKEGRPDRLGTQQQSRVRCRRLGDAPRQDGENDGPRDHSQVEQDRPALRGEPCEELADGCTDDRAQHGEDHPDRAQLDRGQPVGIQHLTALHSA